MTFQSLRFEIVVNLKLIDYQRKFNRVGNRICRVAKVYALDFTRKHWKYNLVKPSDDIRCVLKWAFKIAFLYQY